MNRISKKFGKKGNTVPLKQMNPMKTSKPNKFAWKKSPLAKRAAATPQHLSKINAHRKELLRCCAKLASCEDILAKFDVAIHATGLVGEHRNAKLIFLAVITCMFERPVSIAVKGSSSGGKNTLASAVLSFFPPDAYCELTGMSDKALAYFSRPLKNRVLFISELAGLSSGDGQVFLRNLLSEGFIKYEVTVGKGTRLVEIEGPTGLIITTTDIKLYHDDETRLFSVEVSDTPQQNGKVFLSIGAQEETGVHVSRKPGPEWHALMQWIATMPLVVVNPYGGSIAKLLPVKAPPRLRRDVKAMFALVRAHALLHQKNRKKQADGAVIATLADYKAVRALVKDIVAQGIDAGVAKGVRRTVEAVTKLLKKAPHVSAGQIAAKLNLHKGNVSRHTKAAIEDGYLRNLQESKGKTAQYVLGDPMPMDTDVLPSATAVAKEYRNTMAEKVVAAGKA